MPRARYATPWARSDAASARARPIIGSSRDPRLIEVVHRQQSGHARHLDDDIVVAELARGLLADRDEIVVLAVLEQTGRVCRRGSGEQAASLEHRVQR